MGIPSDDIRDFWVNHKKPSNPQINTTREGIKEGIKAASIACIAATIPTMAAVRFFPWVNANVNYTGLSVAAFFITADKTILDQARSNAWYNKTA